MTRHRRLWMWAFSLFAPLMAVCVAKGDDFLYVLAALPGQRSEIHWIPARAPLSARILVEDLDSSEFIHRHRDELWWWTAGRPVKADLVGQREESLTEFGGAAISNIVRQGDILYWMTTTQLGRFNIQTGENEVLATSVSVDEPGSFLDLGSPVVRIDGRLVFTGGSQGLKGLAIHEDRLYFGDGPKLESIRIDGVDRRQLSERDSDLDSVRQAGTIPFGGFPFSVRSGRGNRGIAVHDDRVVWVKKGAFWQIDPKTGEETQLSVELPESEGVHAMAVTDEAIYWIDGRRVWRWTYGAEEHEPLYELGDTRFNAIAVVTAEPRPATLWDKERVGVVTEDSGVYQLLFSEDLLSWSPDYVRHSLFNINGTLRWLLPKLGGEQESLVWQPNLAAREAYFAVWQYDLGKPYDADGDELPDYWERQHFKDLSATPEGDTNNDGLTHLEEARLFVGPNEVDFDGDGLANVDEIAHEPPLDPTSRDADGDNLTDGEEVNTYHTDPHSTDTDGDGFTDDIEAIFGGAPTDSEVTPSGKALLAAYGRDLVVHFDFESSENVSVPNEGSLGGAGRIVGRASYVVRESETGERSRALNLASDINDLENTSHVETDYRLEDLGFSGDGNAFTVALWLRTARAHQGTVLSATTLFSIEPAFSFQVGTEPHDRMIPLTFSLGGDDWDWSATTRNAVDLGNWTHVVWSEGPEGRKLYVDGDLRSSSNDHIGAVTGRATLLLGAQKGGLRAIEHFLGAVDDVRVYRGVLPEPAIRVLAGSVAP